jgi:kynurenine formamidase
MANIKAALKKQGMKDFKFEAGNAIIFRRRWKKHYGDPTTFNSGCPGIGKEVARRIAKDVQAGVTGGDTWPADAIPNPDPACALYVHTFLQARHNIVNQQHMKLSKLAKDGIYLFIFMCSPAPIRGPMGTPTTIN